MPTEWNKLDISSLRRQLNNPSILAPFTIGDPFIMLGGGIRLIVGFQPLMVISPTASWIRWCMKVYVWCFNVDFFLFGPNDLRLTILGCQATDSIQPHVTTKGITQTIYTDSEPPSQIPNSLMPSAKLRSANLPFLRLWCDAAGDRTPASRTPERTL